MLSQPDYYARDFYRYFYCLHRCNCYTLLSCTPFFVSKFSYRVADGSMCHFANVAMIISYRRFSGCYKSVLLCPLTVSAAVLLCCRQTIHWTPFGCPIAENRMLLPPGSHALQPRLILVRYIRLHKHDNVDKFMIHKRSTHMLLFQRGSCVMHRRQGTYQTNNGA